MAMQIRASRLEDAVSFSEALAEVAAEEAYLATVDGYTVEETRAYIEAALSGAVYQVVAVEEGRVIGACDIRSGQRKGFTHVGQLGMFVRRPWRRQGVGRRLLGACLAVAGRSPLEKVELEVFADNLAALRLYESAGFYREGLKVRGRRWCGRYQDVVLMGRWL